MALLGKLLKNKRAGDERLAWNAPNLAGPNTLEMSSPDFAHETTIPTPHAGKRLGGKDLSPALTWGTAPAGTAQLLLVIEDPDAPTTYPYNHGIALLDPSLTGLPQGGLEAGTPADGVRLLGSGSRRGYLGPAPIKGHGPHRYVFQLFALGKPLTIGRSDTVPDTARPRAVLAAAGNVLARGRLDGFYERV
ncbi:YbhB/YbcL family Raf kinase inhibitor-like protein [Streptomyces sp. NPDC051172]|uniref:YbhB/YbcL family Raf kinase inhibitor-like protein n=1 Tax=Streptomyces sp. NPDC051172 TaxID=3155796 RepID=UPI003419CA11